MAETISTEVDQSEAVRTQNPGALRRALLMTISFPALMAVLLIVIALIGAEPRLIDPDTWWHVTVGEQILKTHTWPTADPYSFTAQGAHWIAYEWLGDVLLALPARSGLVGMAWLQKIVVIILTLLLYLYSYLVSGNSKAACIASAVVLPLAPMAFTLRPQMFGYIFLLLTMICLQRFRAGHERALWFLPPLFVIWANTHGSFVFGLAVIGLSWITSLFSFRVGGLSGQQLPQQNRIKLLLTFLFCVLALLITPYGSQIAANPFEMAIAQPTNIASIQEWQPLTLANPVGTYILVFALALFVAQVILRIDYKIEEITLLIFALYASCAHLRFAMIFVLFAAPVVAAILARWVPAYDSSKDKYLLNAAIIALVIIAVIKFRPSQSELERVIAADYPVHAVEYLRAHPQTGRMFNEYGFGGYLIWRFPAQPVFIDGRADLYEYTGVLLDYMGASAGQATATGVLARHDIRWCLLNRSSSLAALLAESPGWSQIYSDDLSVIFALAGRPKP